LTTVKIAKPLAPFITARGMDFSGFSVDTCPFQKANTQNYDQVKDTRHWQNWSLNEEEQQTNIIE
jgi:hypothetical protein